MFACACARVRIFILLSAPTPLCEHTHTHTHTHSTLLLQRVYHGLQEAQAAAAEGGTSVRAYLLYSACSAFQAAAAFLSGTVSVCTAFTHVHSFSLTALTLAHPLRQIKEMERQQRIANRAEVCSEFTLCCLWGRIRDAHYARALL